MAEADDLIKQFQALERLGSLPSQEGHYTALPWPGRTQDRLALDRHGRPAFLLEVAEGPIIPALELNTLSVQHRVECRILHGLDALEERRFSVVRFVGMDASLQPYFVGVVGAALSTLPHPPTPRTVGRTVQRLAELFLALEQPSRQNVQGLWAELFVLLAGDHTSEMVRAWRETPEAHHDFSLPEFEIEVKSVVGPRIHHVSLEQLRPRTERSVWLASLVLREDTEGPSVLDLAQRIRLRLISDPEAAWAFEAKLASGGAGALASSRRVRFNEAAALDHLYLFQAETLPCIDPTFPAQISGVRFTLNLVKWPASKTTLARLLKGT